MSATSRGVAAGFDTATMSVNGRRRISLMIRSVTDSDGGLRTGTHGGQRLSSVCPQSAQTVAACVHGQTTRENGPMLLIATVIAHLVADIQVDPSRDTLHVWDTVASPLLTAGEYLIPAGVALSSLHRVMQHQESSSGFLVDMLVKGGGAVLVIQLVKSFLHV
jgi:hypothetical protein